MGAPKKTAKQYAQENDDIGEGRLADALRLRATRHEKCEDLALGGFSTRRFPDLLTDLAEMTTYVDA